METEKKNNWGRGDTSEACSNHGNWSRSMTDTSSKGNSGSVKSISSVDDIPDLEEEVITKQSLTFTTPVPQPVDDPFRLDSPSKPICKPEPTIDLFTKDISHGISKGMASLLSDSLTKENIPPMFNPSPFEFSSRVKRDSAVLTPNCPKKSKKVVKCKDALGLEVSC